VKAAATKAAILAKDTPAQRALAHKKASAAAHKAATTRAKDVTLFELAHKGKKPTGTQLSAFTKGLARPGSGPWILGGNDEFDSCVATAFANSLLLATGRRATEDDVLELFDITGLGTILEGLEALMIVGLAGCRPKSFAMTDVIGSGTVLGLPAHAATADGDCLITWGDKVPLDPRQVDQAWSIEW